VIVVKVVCPNCTCGAGAEKPPPPCPSGQGEIGLIGLAE